MQQRNVPLLSVKDSVSFCEFDSVQLSAQLNRTVSRYVWDGNTSQESTYWAGKNKIYTAQAYDDLNCPSAVYDIKVHEILRPKMSIKSSAKDYVCENGDPITLTAETPDPLRPADRYEWNNGSTESSISVNKGSTFVVWGYLHGCVSAPDTLPIAFKMAPQVSIKGVKEICTDSSATLMAQGTAAHYFWNGSASADTLYEVTKTGDYTLVGADTFGCKAYDTLHVQQRDVPLLSVKDSVSFCEFDSLLLTASLNRTAAFYVWDGDTIQSANHWLNQDRLYTVKAYDDLMCPSELKNVKSHIVLRPVVKISATKDYVCENGDPVTLTASQPDATRPADAYLWEPNGETASAIQVYKGDTYRLYGSLHGCVSQPDTYAIEQKYIPKLSIAEGPVAKYCDMLSVTLHAISPTATSYSWSPKTSTADTLNTNEENTYTVVVKDTFGCVNSAKVRTEAIKGPQVRIDGDTIICQHNFALLTAICSECDSLAWSTGSDETSIEAYKAGDYIVVGYNGVGCPSAPAIHHLAVRDIPQIAITGITDITSNDSTILTADVAGEEPFLFNWAPTKETTQSIVVRGSDMRTLTRIYTATVFDRWGCYNYALAKITKHSINLTGKTAFCQGDSSKLTASGDDVTSYLWSTGDTSNSITVNKGGEYSIITGHTNGMIDTFTFTVTVHGLPIVRFLGNPYFCKGDSTIITAKADSSTYLWNTGTKDSSVIVRDSGLYSVVATTVYGCVDSDSIYVKEYPLPIVTIAGPDSVLEEGSIFLDAGGALSYHWADPDTVAQRVEVFKAMRYRVVGTDVNGCKNTAVHDVAMIPIPHPLINDTTNGHTVICDGDHYKLIASGAETYTWDDGEKTDTINVTESRIYTVTGCLSNGQCRSTTFSVEVSPLPKMLRIDGDTKFCPDTFSVLTAHAVDDSLISHYFWSTGENTQSIKVTDADSFSVHALSVYGCLSDTLSVVTSLYGTPVITFDGLREICQNSSTEITAHGGTRYVWLGENIYTPEITITEPGDYTARVIDGNGCHSDSTIFIQDMGLPKLRIAGSSSFCEGDSVRLRIDGDKFTENFYHWNTGSESDSIIISKPGVYVASISNHAGCETFDTITVVEYPNPVITIDGPSMVCFGDSVPLTCTELSGNEIVRYEWSHGPTVQTVYVSESDSFSVIATDVHGCISNVDSQYVWQRVPKPVNITGDFNICVEREDTAVMVASCPEVVYYKWVSEQTGDTLIADSNAYGAIAPGKYRAIATDQYGCSSYLTAQVTGRKNPKVKIRGAEIPVCDRDTATLTADVDNDVRYKWNTGDTTKNILCPKSGVFMLYGVSRFDCYSSDTANLILNDIPAMETSKNLGFCPGKSTDVTVSGAQSYLWSNGSTSDHAEFNAAGSEFVIGTDKYGCHKRINFNIYQFHVPEIMIMASPSTFERTHPVVNFDVTSNDTLDNCMFKWTLGDGNTEEAQSFAYTYDITNQRRFFIGLLMTTTDGCEKSVQTSVACDLDIPNTITPNGDGINDVFMKGCKVEIYDRHGVTIHKGDNGWDGRLKDGRVVADTYFYVLTDITEEKYYGYLTVRVQ